MLFTHDTEISFNATAALVNTARGGAEELPDIAALDAFVGALELDRQPDPRPGRAGRGARAAPPARRALGDDRRTRRSSLVNALLRDANALPQLLKHDGWEYHIHATSPDAPLADRMAVDAAMAFADVIRFGELGRLRYCAARRLRRRARRPVQEPLAPVLQPDLREPGQRGRLPVPPQRRKHRASPPSPCGFGPV